MPFRKVLRQPAAYMALAFVSALPAAAALLPLSDFKDFGTTLASAKPGDEIVVRNGSYASVKVHFKAQGLEGKPIILRAETPGQAILTGSTELVVDGAHLVVSGLKLENLANLTQVTTPYDVEVARAVLFTKASHHCRLTETAIMNGGSGVRNFVHMEPGSQYHQVDHCWFSGQTGPGVHLYVEAHPQNPSYHVFARNYVGDRRQGSGNGWETVRAGHSEQQYFRLAATFAGNFFTKNDGENEMISNKSTGNKYLHNAIVDNHGELTLRHGDEAWIEGNFFLNTGRGQPGLRMIGSRHVVFNNYFRGTGFAFNVYAGETNPEPKGYTQVKDATIAFNTMENVGTEFTLGSSGRPAAPKNLRIFYNLAQSNGGGVLNYENGSTDARYQGNIFYGGSGGAREGVVTEKPAMLADKLGRLVADASKLPFKVDPAAVPQAAKDMNGTARGAAWNVGALQTPDGEPPYPLSAKEVGPLWMGNTKWQGNTALYAGPSAKRQARVFSVLALPGGDVRVLAPFHRGRPETLLIHDLRGGLVKVLPMDGDRARWDGRDRRGRPAPAGTYLLRSMSGEGESVRFERRR